jgi:hypothetical protein
MIDKFELDEMQIMAELKVRQMVDMFTSQFEVKYGGQKGNGQNGSGLEQAGNPTRGIVGGTDTGQPQYNQAIGG